MKTRLLFTAALLLVALTVKAQDKVDSLSNFAYLRKGDPMPFDSGVAISERQYQHIFKMALIGRIESGTDKILTPVPRTVYVDREIRKEGDGNKVTWSSIGAAGGSLLTALIFVLTK